MNSLHERVWRGCYKGQYDLWTAESYTHPAKMSPGLCHRIFDHLEELGLLRKGAVILDPMAGIGTTGLVAARRGYESIMVELEPKFVDLIKGNRDRMASKWGGFIGERGMPEMQIIQGDARRLSGLLVERGLVSGMSPPSTTQPQYGKTEGQIGQEQGPTYLSEMEKIYTELARVASVLVVVVKNPTRGGKLRMLSEDTVALLESCGWAIYCRHRAMLFEETEQGHLFEGSQKRVKGRMSFFKRLAWAKGSVVAQWEDILIAVNGKETGMCGITSPPYFQSEKEGTDSTIAIRGRNALRNNYGDTPGQIGKLK